MKNIYWKLQSVNASETLEVGSKEFEIYREHYKKDYTTRELMSEQETIESYEKQAWKNPLFSRIFSLTLAFVEDNTVRVKYFTGTEKDLIQTFLNTLKSDYFKDYKITHFGAEYILPYLGTRIDMNSIKTTIPSGLTYRGIRMWNLTGLCVKDYYSGAGNYKNSLKELAWVYGIQTDFIEPADEFTYYKSGKLKELKESAVSEIFTLVNVHRAMFGEDLIPDLIWVEQHVENVQEEKPTDVLVLLFETKKFSGAVKEELLKKFAKKKPTKKDKENLKKIIIAHYLEIVDVMDFDKVKKEKEAINEERTKEVNEFIDNL